jgi:hypothetical protein
MRTDWKDTHAYLGPDIAATYDRIMSGAGESGLAEPRRLLLADATGDVLEIGGGTEANLSLYGGMVRAARALAGPNAPISVRLATHAGAPARSSRSAASSYRSSAEGSSLHAAARRARR